MSATVTQNFVSQLLKMLILWKLEIITNQIIKITSLTPSWAELGMVKNRNPFFLSYFHLISNWIAQKVIIRFSKSWHFWKLEIKLHWKKKSPFSILFKNSILFYSINSFCSPHHFSIVWWARLPLVGSPITLIPPPSLRLRCLVHDTITVCPCSIFVYFWFIRDPV